MAKGVGADAALELGGRAAEEVVDAGDLVGLDVGRQVGEARAQLAWSMRGSRAASAATVRAPNEKPVPHRGSPG